MNYKELKQKLRETFWDYPVDKLLTAVIWGEARGEEFIGKVSIGYVIMNRAKRKKNTPIRKAIKEVILKPYQFSSFLPDDPNFEKILNIINDTYIPSLHKSTIGECFMAGYIAFHELIEDPTNGATHYYANYIIKPSWANSMQVTAIIGNHIFLREV